MPVEARASRGGNDGSFIAESKVFVKAELNSDGDAKLNGMAHVGNNIARLVLLTPATPDQATLTDLMSAEYLALITLPS